METQSPSKKSEAVPLGASLGREAAGGPFDFPQPVRRWLAVYTMSRHEKYVSEALLDRGIETFLPRYRTVRRWRKSGPVTLELPLFPNYLFVHVAEQARFKVLQVSGALSIVGSRREAWPLPDAEIESLRTGLHLHKAEPHPYLVVGDRARIVVGPLAGMEGVLVRKKNNLHVVLTVQHIMQSISVEVAAEDLESVASHPVRIHLA